MTNFIPIFPLSIVVYPGESINLHIFEERYKQLITECYAEKKFFGVPPVINSHIGELGTLLGITEIVEVYEDGKMDIRVEGTGIFRILEIIKQVPDKLFSGAIVKHLANEMNPPENLLRYVLASVRELHQLLKVSKDLKKADGQLLSYDMAHHAGLSLQEEYELLGLFREDQRLEYLKRHLQKTLTVAAGIESLKERIQLNGHFRELKGFNLDL